MAVRDRTSSPAPPAGAPVTSASRHVVHDLASRWEQAGTYVLLDGRLRCTAARGPLPVLDGLAPWTGAVGRSVTTGLTVVDDVPDDPKSVTGAGCQVSAPVSLEGRCVGAVVITSREPLPAEAVADAERAAAALAQALPRGIGTPPTPMTQRIARLAVDLGALADLERLRRAVVEGACAISGRSTAALAAVSPAGQWEVVSATGPLAQALSDWGDAELASLARRVRIGTSVHVQMGTDAPPEHDFLSRSGVRSVSVQPLVVGGTLTGLLVVVDPEPQEHDPVAVAATEVLAGLAASSLRSAALQQDLAERAREALTGLPRENDFRDDLTEACVDAIRSREVTHTCMLLELEGAKGAEGQDGPSGDALLSALVEALTGQLRHGDVLYRVTGTGFAVLLATGAPESAGAVADRLDRAAREAGAPIRLGWALVDGPPASVSAAVEQSLDAARYDVRTR